ncbi:nucleotide-sugar transporter-domain-containing protein, partial [Dichotomocladium elegans]
ALFFGVPLKYLSLLILVVQNSALILVMRYTRANVPEDQRYLASTAVIMSEVLKTLVCLVLIYYTPQKPTMTRLVAVLQRELIQKWREACLLAFPAVLYLIQNNLQYVAATNLDAATFQVTYQLKILTTAFFSVVILRKPLSRGKWAALALLTVGIALVVLPKDTSAYVMAWFFSTEYQSISEETEAQSVGNQSNAEGFFAVLAACMLSGLAGVYFEKILKSPTKPPPPSQPEEHDSAQLWIRNIQMSFFSILVGMVFVVLLQDGTTIAEKGFFVNYTHLTWCVIGIQAFGGLIVALVVKYADSILKGFATSISIILSSLLSVFIFNFSITATFVIGATFVIYATYLYGL